MSKLIFQTARTFLLGALALGAFLFIPAWTLNYWQAWLFILVFMTSSTANSVYLAIRNPQLLERRKKGGPMGEQSKTQKVIISAAVVTDAVVWVFCALDHRFGWSALPPFVSLVGDVLVALGFLIDFFVFKENSYASSTVQIFEGQKVISTGPYALVRHPMYVGVLVMGIGAPLALGSWWGLVVYALTTPILIWRILDEEQHLKNDLPGYREYTQTVRYRLVPYLW